MAPDVTWDGDSQQRFLERIAAESARLGRLGRRPARLLRDRVRGDAPPARLVRHPPGLEAAVACLPPSRPRAVTVACDPALPAVWADHDRLEQVFVNLLNNAFRHNPPGTDVAGHRRSPRARPRARSTWPTTARASRANWRRNAVRRRAAPPFAHRRGRPGPVHRPRHHRAHGGQIELAAVTPGTTWRIRLPIESVALSPGAGDGAREEEIADLAAEHPPVARPSIAAKRRCLSRSPPRGRCWSRTTPTSST